MSNRVAIRYAKAVSERVKSKEQADKINSDMKLIFQTITANKELDRFMKNPVFSTEVKQSVLSEIFPEIDRETQLLFRLLAENKRLNILPLIAKAYNDLYDRANGVQKIIVTTAFPITEKLESKVIAKAKEFTSESLVIKNIVDPSIIGGFIIRIGDKQYNASITNRINKLKRKFIN